MAISFMQFLKVCAADFVLLVIFLRKKRLRLLFLLFHNVFAYICVILVSGEFLLSVLIINSINM